MRIEVYSGLIKGWYWRAVSRNGRVVADGAERYESKHSAVRAAHRFIDRMRTFPEPSVEIVE